jgi:peptidoglycan/LPS O-acetylase OafA/YrhL
MTLLTQSRPATARQVPPVSGGALPSLTGMRWVAAFMVFAYHIRNFGYFGGQGGRIMNWAFGAGACGVSFFFILSGFVLAWSARPHDRSRAFWRRRVARIYPVHLATTALTVLLACTLVPSLRPGSLPESLANLALVSAWKQDWWQTLNPVSWSLTCEAFFYAVFPALHAILRRLGPRALTGVVAANVVLVIAWPWANERYHLGWWLPHFPLTRLPEFILGAAAARLVQLGAWRGPGLDASMAMTLIGYFLIGQLPGPYGTAACTVLGLTCLICAAARADLGVAPSSLWRHPWLVRLGEWSFAFYMIHILVLRTGEQLFGTNPQLALGSALAATLAAFLVSLTLAWALYQAVERPGRRLLLSSRPLRP